MFGKKRSSIKPGRIDSLIGRQTEFTGDVRFSGGLHVDGVIKGNVIADEDSDAVLTLSEHGSVRGQISVPQVVLSGAVMGDVYAERHVELTSSARISGDVYYGLIEMAMGAEVNGSLIPRVEGAEVASRAAVSDEPSPLQPPLRATRDDEPE
jgi:cytoskeletal protein CcmA (bactofilin family)